MTLQEIMRAKGLTDEQIAGIVTAMKENKVFTAGEENLDIRYQKLKADHDSLTAQYGESTKLIEQLKAGTQDSEALQGKIAAYEAQVQNLNEALNHARLTAAVQVALMRAKATDPDYMAYKLFQKDELELDDKGMIKGIDDKIAALRTQFPAQFESEAQRKIDEQRLPDPDNREPATPQTLADALQQRYETD